jgi:hypothetical protein
VAAFSLTTLGFELFPSSLGWPRVGGGVGVGVVVGVGLFGRGRLRGRAPGPIMASFWFASGMLASSEGSELERPSELFETRGSVAPGAGGECTRVRRAYGTTERKGAHVRNTGIK